MNFKLVVEPDPDQEMLIYRTLLYAISPDSDQDEFDDLIATNHYAFKWCALRFAKRWAAKAAKKHLEPIEPSKFKPVLEWEFTA